MAAESLSADKAEVAVAETQARGQTTVQATATASRPTREGAEVVQSTPARRIRRASAVGVREEMAEREELGEFRIWLRESVSSAPSWLVSMVFHMILLLGLGLYWLPAEAVDEVRQLVIASNENQPLEDLEALADEPLQEINVEITAEAVEVVSKVEAEDVEISPADDMEAAAVHVDLDDFGLEHAPRNDLLASAGTYMGSGLSGRGSKSRAALVRKLGGSAGSEKAVTAALKWLARHQMPDGGWSFNHCLAPSCQGKCRNPGSTAEARNAATAMALLPFLGAGQTHKEGKYKATVNSGLYFLINHMKISPNGGALNEAGGMMYSHGLASIVLCEAYAMTQDKGLHNPAQAVVNFICYAQDPGGGGWRYEPQQAGDTSVVGWQIMALKSGHMAYLRVPPLVVKKAYMFLDHVQAESGAFYGYTGPGTGQATTAIGLLCRMYLGWKKDHGALQRGVQHLAEWGPSGGNMYYNYYATQVCRHWEGDVWKKWNSVMRDQLVNSQAKGGHEAGSWFMPRGDHGADRGGRLYCTSMATMILEVYYRHLPIYRKQSTEEEFPE